MTSFLRYQPELRPASPPAWDKGDAVLAELMTFKASERKDDPSRIPDIHGPYEEATIRKTGKLPADYFAPGDPAPWGLRLRESRSNILWQVLSGLMDRHPEFGAAYMALALDHVLDEKEYGAELRALNKRWGDYLDNSGIFRDHHHSAMKHTYTRVSCPACSALTAMACVDAGMQSLFMDMIPLSSAERRRLLSENGLVPLLDTMIPDQKPQPKLEG